MAACNASALTCDVKIASALTKAAKNASVVRGMRNIWMEGQGARPEASAGCIQGAPQLKFNSVDDGEVQVQVQIQALVLVQVQLLGASTSTWCKYIPEADQSKRNLVVNQCCNVVEWLLVS